MEKSAVFFDIDGTLWNYDKYIPDSTRVAIKKLREKYKAKIENNVLKEDLLLNSPSQAAMFCVLSSVSGNVAWVDSEGNKLK